MPKDGRYDDLTAFLDARGDALLRTAVLLTPGREAGQDLLQEALERLLRKWHKVNGDPEGYLRRIMYNRAADGWRSRARRPEVLGLPADAAVADHASRLDLRLTLIAALELLTPRQRAAVVARYWEQLSEAETAAALGCSVSAVKAAAARGLKTLRQAIAPDMECAPKTINGGSRTMTRYYADLGDSDPGTEVRAIMTVSVSDIRMPADLLDRAVSRNRQRKARHLLTGAVGAAAVVAVAATVIAAVPGRSSGRPAFRRQTVGLQAQTAAYVLNRAAAAQVNSYRMISVDKNAAGGIFYTDVATQQQRIVSSLLDSSGQPYFQIGTAVGGGAYKETDVEYQHHVYSTFTTSSIDNGQQVTLSSFLPLQTNPDPAVAFNKALKAGIITVVGHRSLDGQDTILIRVKPESRLKPGFTRASAGVEPASWIWIDASTYLVVQTEHFVPRFPGGSAPGTASRPGSRHTVTKVTWSPIVDHVTWLSPTPRNLALLTLTPPAGFTKIPYSELVQKYLGPIS